VKPVVAIVGRPNVGKSTLFNRVVGGRGAIVEDVPGVTRDRHYAEADWSGRSFLLVDTGGFEPQTDVPILIEMRRQTQVAIDEADVVLLLGDARDGLLPSDAEVAEHLRRAGKPTVLGVNKVDGPAQEAAALEFHRLGCDSVFPIAAEHGRGISDLMDAVVRLLPAEGAAEAETPESGFPRVAVIGRPNSGKSSLINRLLGEERLLTFAEPGTTRDPIDTVLRRGEREYHLIDTAGIRRQRSIHDRLERVCVVRALKALDRADLAWLLIDGEAGVAEQDAKVAAFAHDKGRALILVVNKWDLASGRPDAARRFREEIERKLQFISYAPVVFVSARTGSRVGRLLELTDRVFSAYGERIATAPLNRFFREALERHPPPSDGGRLVKLYYITQVSTRPPTFVVSVNRLESIHFSYKRYVVNQLRKSFGFEGVPLRVLYRRRGEAASGGKGAS
jgi:GTP-binding protein